MLLKKSMSRSKGLLVTEGLCLQRGLLHCPRPAGLGRQERGCGGCQLTFLKQFMGFQSSRGVSGVEQSQLPRHWRRKAGGTRKGRKRLRPGRVETLQPVNCFSVVRSGKQTRVCFAPAPRSRPSSLPCSALALPGLLSWLLQRQDLGGDWKDRGDKWALPQHAEQTWTELRAGEQSVLQAACSTSRGCLCRALCSDEVSAIRFN